MRSPRPLGTAGTVMSAAAIVVSGAMPVALLAAFAVRIEQSLSISDAQVGAALSLYFGVSVAFAISAGRLADSLGPPRALSLAAGLTIVSLLGAATLARTYPVLLAFFVVGGIGQALAAPTSNVILADGVRAERIGIAMGFKQASVPLGSLIAGIAITFMAAGISWRWPFAFAALIPAIAIVNAIRIHPASPTKTKVSRSSAAKPVTVGQVWRFGLAGGLSTFTASAMTGFLILGLVDAGYVESAAGIVLTVSALGSIAVRIGSGYLRDRLQFSAASGAAVLLGCGALGFLLAVSSSGFLVPIGAVIAYSAGWGWPAMFHLALVEMYPSSPGAATGIARVGLAGGNSVGPLFFGVVFETAGYRVGWSIAGLGMVGAGVAIWWASFHAARDDA